MKVNKKQLTCKVDEFWMEGDDYVAFCRWPDGGVSIEKFDRMPKVGAWIKI